MSTIKIPLSRPYIDNKDRKAVDAVLRTDFLSLGPKLVEFEDNFATYIGIEGSCAVSSGTAGLHLAVKALGIGIGDEVITSPFSFIASSNCLLYEGAKPVFVDIDETTFNMDPTKIESVITKRTKAILVVHIFGQTAQMDQIMEIAKKHNLKIIEDACESLGARFKGKVAGTFGDLGIFAFYPNKQMTTGEGGMIVSNSKKLLSVVKSLRNQGRVESKKQSFSSNKWLKSEILGYNYRLDEMSCALGISQLKKIKFMIGQRRRVASTYNRVLSGLQWILQPQIGTERTHTWFVYVVRITNGKRNLIINKLAKKGIQTRNYLPVIHLQPFMKKMFGFKKGDFPVCEKISSETLALPIFVGLSTKDIKYVCDEIKNI